MHDPDLLLLYSTGSLNDDERAHIEAHLAACDSCRAALQEWRDIAAAVQSRAEKTALSLPPLSLPEHPMGTRNFVSTLNGNRKETLPMTAITLKRSTTRQRSFAALAAAGIMALLVLASSFFNRAPDTYSTLILQAVSDTPTFSATDQYATAQALAFSFLTQTATMWTVTPSGAPTITPTQLPTFTMTPSWTPTGTVATSIADPNLIFHVVASGETLFSIAQHYGVDVEGLLLANDLLSDSAVNVGDVIVIPISSPAAMPENLQPVVIAVRDLPVNTVITEEDVTVVYYPSDIAPYNSFESIENLLTTVVYTTQPIRQWQPIQFSELALGTPEPLTVPQGMIAVTLPLELASLTQTSNPILEAMSIYERDYVDIAVAMMFINVDENGQSESDQLPQPLAQILVDDALIIDLQMIEDENLSTYQYTMTVAVSPDDAIILNWIIEARLPILPLRTGYIAGERPDNSQFSQTLSTISIPSSQPVETGTFVDLQVPIRYTDEAGLHHTAFSIDNLRVGEVEADGTISIEAPLIDIVVLQWAIDAGLTIEVIPEGEFQQIVQSTPVPTAVLAGMMLPPGMIGVTIPAEREIIDRLRIVPGDYVDIAAAMMFVPADNPSNTEGTSIPPIPAAHIITMDALVMYVGYVPGSDSNQYVMTLSITPEDAATLNWALEAQLPLLPIPAVYVGSVLEPRVLTGLVELPLNQFTPLGGEIPLSDDTIVDLEVPIGYTDASGLNHTSFTITDVMITVVYGTDVVQVRASTLDLITLEWAIEAGLTIEVILNQ